MVDILEGHHLYSDPDIPLTDSKIDLTPEGEELMAAIPMGKTRPKSDPWLIYEGPNGWTWRVLKAYSADPNKPYARWFCDVESPFTAPGSDLGDTYVQDVVRYGRLTYADPSVPASAYTVGR